MELGMKNKKERLNIQESGQKRQITKRPSKLAHGRVDFKYHTRKRRRTARKTARNMLDIKEWEVLLDLRKAPTWILHPESALEGESATGTPQARSSPVKLSEGGSAQTGRV